MKPSYIYFDCLTKGIIMLADNFFFTFYWAFYMFLLYFSIFHVNLVLLHYFKVNETRNLTALWRTIFFKLNTSSLSVADIRKAWYIFGSCLKIWILKHLLILMGFFFYSCRIKAIQDSHEILKNITKTCKKSYTEWWRVKFKENGSS
jgi:hypothetical protein